MAVSAQTLLKHPRRVQKVSFPEAVYRNKIQLMKRFIGTDTASIELFFNIFTSGIDTFVIPWDLLLFPCLVEVCRLGLEPLRDISHLGYSRKYLLS